MPTEFCHCHSHSRFSFKDGLAAVDELVARAAELGQPGFGLTDHGVLFGAPDLFKACKEHGVRGMIGMEAYEAVPHTFDLERDNEIFKIKWSDLAGRDRYYHLTLWVLNETGWKNLCELHTRSHTPTYFPTQRGKPLLDRANLEELSEGLAVGLGCVASRTNVTLARTGEDAAYKQAKWYAEVFGDRCLVEVMGNTSDQQALLRGQRKLAKRLGVRTLATNDVHYLERTDGVEHGPHHILVQARAYKRADTEKSSDLSDDGFGSWYGTDGFYLKSAEEMLATGGLLPEDLAESVTLLDRVSFDFSALPKPKPPVAAVPGVGDDPAFDAFCSTLV